MAGIIEWILFAGICLIVLGASPKPSVEVSRRGGPFLETLLEALKQNPPEKLMQRVDSAARRSTCK